MPYVDKKEYPLIILRDKMCDADNKYYGKSKREGKLCCCILHTLSSLWQHVKQRRRGLHVVLWCFKENLQCDFFTEHVWSAAITHPVFFFFFSSCHLVVNMELILCRVRRSGYNILRASAVFLNLSGEKPNTQECSQFHSAYWFSRAHSARMLVWSIPGRWVLAAGQSTHTLGSRVDVFSGTRCSRTLSAVLRITQAWSWKCKC